MSLNFAFKFHHSYCFLLGALVLLIASTAAAQGINLIAEVDSNEVVEGEAFFYTITASSTAGVQPQIPSLPDFGPFQVLERGRPSTQSSFTIVNGRQSSEIKIVQQVKLRAPKSGSYQIPPATLAAGGTTVKSNPVQIAVYPLDEAVQGGTAKMPEPRSQNLNYARLLRGKVFVRAEISNAEPFVREPVLISYYLYWKSNAPMSGAGVQQEPMFEQAIAEDLTGNTRQLQTEQTMFEGEQWNRALIRRYRVAPLSTGTALYSGLMAQVQHGDGFFMTNSAIVESLPVKMQVQPLPDPAPEEFTGTVGRITLNGPQLDRRELTTDDIVVWQIQIDGTAPAQIIQPPKLPAELEDFEMFNARFVDPVGAAPAKPRTFEWALRPTRDGELEIPAVPYGYFNPETEQYDAITLPAQPIKVAKGSANAPLIVAQGAGPRTNGAAGHSSQIVEMGQALRYIKTDDAGEWMRSESLTRQGLPSAAAMWVMALLPPVAVLGAWGWGRRREWLESHRDEARRRAAHGIARRQLKAARKLLAGGESNADAFYAETARAIRAFVGAKLGLAPAGLTSDEVRSRLHAAGCAPEIAESAARLLEQCDAARYSPAAATAAGMQATLTEAAKTLDALAQALRKK